MPKKTAVIDVGGGLRDIYGAGIFDTLIDEGILFDMGLGISAGAANLCSFMAGQKGRNYTYFIDYAMRPEYMSLSNLPEKHVYIDLDYVYSTLSDSDGEYPLDFSAMMKSPMELIIQATNAYTGKPARFDTSWIHQDDYELLKCTCALPFASRSFSLAGLPYFDGGISDPIPIQWVLEQGYDKVVLILTRPADQFRTEKKDQIFARMMEHEYPKTAQSLRQRASKYNACLTRARELEKAGKVLILAPETIGNLKTLSKDTEMLQKLYEKGVEDGFKVKKFLTSQKS